MAAVVLMTLELKPTRYNGDFMTLNKLSNADLNAIVLAAEEVISALAGENDEVHRDNSSKMCAIWDDLNDRYAPPEVVKAMASELLAYRNSSQKPVVWTDGVELRDIEKHGCAYIFKIDPTNQFTDPHRQIMLYTAPQPTADMEELQNQRNEDNK